MWPLLTLYYNPAHCCLCSFNNTFNLAKDLFAMQMMAQNTLNKFNTILLELPHGQTTF